MNKSFAQATAFGRGGFRKSAAARILPVLALALSLGGATLSVPAQGASTGSDTAIAVRKNVTALSAEEKADFVDAILRLKTTPSPAGDEVGNWYDHFVASHMRKLVCYTDEPGQGGYGHNGPDLITWHRAYMLEFEAAMTSVMGKTMTIPYWDWTDPDSLDTVFAEDFMGPVGDPDQDYAVMKGPFRLGEWRINVKGFEATNPGQYSYIVRASGQPEGSVDLPTPGEVQQALLRPEYDSAPWGVVSDMDTSFRAFTDGMISATGTTCDGGAISVVDVTGTLLHGTVHMWVGGFLPNGDPGSLADTVTSPNDPVFWLHHANIDRIAEAWWSIHDYQFLPISGGPRGSNLGDRMWPYDITHAEVVVPTEELGYAYDVPIALDPEAEFIGATDWIEMRGYTGHSH